MNIESTATTKLESILVRIKTTKFPSKKDLNLQFEIETELELRK